MAVAPPKRRERKPVQVMDETAHRFRVPFPEHGTLADLRDIMTSIKMHPDEAEFSRDEDGRLVITY